MNLRRDCVHEAGHSYVAFLHHPARAISICIAGGIRTDPFTGEPYRLVGQAVTFDPLDSNPSVLMRIRAGGLAAENINYDQSFEELVTNPEVRFRIKTNTDNAKRDLDRAGFAPTSEEQFVSFYWRVGFQGAVTMMEGSQEKLVRIADYCQLNPGRDIPTSELVRIRDL
jgi:hypothetical protein